MPMDLAARERIEAEALAAFRSDVNYMIEMAKAANQAAAREAEMQEDARRAFDPATDPEEAAQLRKTINGRRWARIAAHKALEASEAAQETGISR